MVLDTQHQQQNGNLFAVNTYGTQVDALVERNETGYGLNFSWNAVWRTKTSVIENDKVYEIAIPFKALNFDKENTTFGVQFYVRDIKNNSWTILTDLSRNTQKNMDRFPDDENRLFYVGATRTKDHLHIIKPKDIYKAFRV